MKFRKGLITLAAGAILATTAAAYSAPAQNYYSSNGSRQEVQRGYALIRQGEQLERTGHRRQGEELERRGRALVREGERRERLGDRHEYNEWRR